VSAWLLQIDGSTADNIIVGSGLEASEVKVYRPIAVTPGSAPGCSRLQPYPDDRPA
jgi:hypothetical protein